MASGGGGARRGSARDRIESLLDAAAAVVDRDGVDGLTTTGLALGAGTSVGTVYRYFPDRLGVIAGIRSRCARVLGLRLDAALVPPSPGGWPEVVERVHGTLVACHREVPGFRAVAAAEDWLHADDGALARRIVAMGAASIVRADQAGHATLDVRPEASAPPGLPDALRIVDALVRSAFERSGAGDAELLGLALRLAVGELAAPARMDV